MEQNILDLLARFDGTNARLDSHAVRTGLLTSREVALVLSCGVTEAARVVADLSMVRSSVADMALAWREVRWPAAPLPPPMCVLEGATRALSLLASMDAVRAALRWLAESEPFWELLKAQRARRSR
jgi:hypothetical protein